MEKKHTVGTIPKSNRKIDTLAHKYMTVHSPGLVQALRLNNYDVSKRTFYMKRMAFESKCTSPIKPQRIAFHT